jgi:hypothetical protein
MTEVPAFREMDLKLSQDLSRPSSQQQFDPAGTSAAVVSVARIDLEIGSYAVIPIQKIPGYV